MTHPDETKKESVSSELAPGTAQLPHPIPITSENIKDILENVDTIVSDCDGVIWTLQKAIPRSLKTLSKLREMGKKVFFVSNNSLLSEESIRLKFHKLGYEIEPGEVCFPSLAIAEYLRSVNFQKKALVLGVDAFKQVLKEAGIDIVEPGTTTIAESTTSLREAVLSVESQDIGAVICDLDFNLTYPGLSKAAHALQNRDCLFIVGATDRRVPFHTADGEALIGPGFTAQLLSRMACRKPDLVVGKPSTFMMDSLQRKHHIDLSRAMYIGDQILLDFQMAHACGLSKTLLVLSGVSKMKDLEDCSPEFVPEYVIDSLGQLSSLISE